MLSTLAIMGTVIAVTFLTSWMLLLVVILLASYVVDFELPTFGELLFKLAVVALASNGAVVLLTVLVDPSGLLGSLFGLVIYWGLLTTFFRLDFMAVFGIVVITWGLRLWLASLLSILQ